MITKENLIEVSGLFLFIAIIVLFFISVIYFSEKKEITEREYSYVQECVEKYPEIKDYVSYCLKDNIISKREYTKICNKASGVDKERRVEKLKNQVNLEETVSLSWTRP